jgi:uncharacterized protein (TIGR00730 family)
MSGKVTVFCASSNQVGEAYYEAARKTGEQLVIAGYSIFYGGGKSGLMGRLADSVIKQNGLITGVQPHFMHQQHWFHAGISDLILVDDMGERKRILFKEADAIVALAGGVGTLDELLEAITLKQLGQYIWPIVIVNTNGFFDHLLRQLDKMAEENFIRKEHLGLWTVINDADQLVDSIRNAPPWDWSGIHSAQI